MAKQFLISAMEDILGEYVVNISKENLKIAALQGKVKLENVQLDGELIGSHILGSITGLSGFGVLSCWAESLKIILPLRELEKQPTRFEIHGIHLLCVPLLPSTSSFTQNGVSLRTRAKRSALARLERNFFHGRIPGEGPPTRRMENAMKHAEKELKAAAAKVKRKQQHRRRHSKDSSASLKLDDNHNHVPESFIFQRNWRVKMREKLLRNMEISIRKMHIRCEVSQGGLDYHNSTRGSEELPAHQRAFCFGITLDSFVLRTAEKSKNDANELKKKSSIDHNDNDNEHNNNEPPFVSPLASENDQPKMAVWTLPSATSPDVKHKVAEINNLSVYWDDSPPNRLAEEHFTGNKSFSITLAMDECLDEKHDFILKNFCSQLSVMLGDRNQPGMMSLIAECMPLFLQLTFRPHQLVQYDKLKGAMQNQQRFDTMLRQRPHQSPSVKPRLWWKYLIACVITRPTSRSWEDIQRIVRCRQRYMELVELKLSKKGGHSGFHGGLSEALSLELLEMEDLLPIEALSAFHLIVLRKVYEVRKASNTNFFEEGEDRDGLTSGKSPRRRASPHRKLRPLFRWNKKKEPPPWDQQQEVEDPSQRLLQDDNTNNDDGEEECSSQQLSSHHSHNSHDLTEGMEKELSFSSANSLFEQQDQNHNQYSKGVVYQEILARMGKKQWCTLLSVKDASLHIILQEEDQAILEVSLSACAQGNTCGPCGDFLFDIFCFEILDPQKQTIADNKLLLPDKLLLFEEAHRVANNDSTSNNDNNDSNTLEPPPPGIVCRLTATRQEYSVHLGISAHPATLVWSKPCFQALQDFFSFSKEKELLIGKQLRLVASPLARRAILACQRPSEFQFLMNICAPKLWLPISSETAAFLDAGRFRMKIHSPQSKQQKLSDTSLQISAKDISLQLVSETNNLSIIQPLQLSADAILAERELSLQSILRGMPIKDDQGPWRKLTVDISPIRLDLVDAEVLVRAIGKWYTQGLVRVQKKQSKKIKEQQKKNDSKLDKRITPGVSILSIHVQRLEVALEGHSKRIHDDDDDEPRKRAYLVKLVSINVGRLAQQGQSRNNLLVQDAYIVRLNEASSTTRANEEAMLQQYEHWILVRSDTPSTTILTNTDDTSEANDISTFLHVTLFHDDSCHLDEVEIDFDAIVLRITPTTLKDCATGLRRILELVQLVTKEMERKIHDVVAKESDSSILFKVNLKPLTLLLGRHNNAVIQIMSHAMLVMFQSIENKNGSGRKTLHLSINELQGSAHQMLQPQQLQTSLGPTSIEFRVAYGTENCGSIVSQDIYLDSEALPIHLSPAEFRLVQRVVEGFQKRLNSPVDEKLHSLQQHQNRRRSFLRYQKKGTGIMTNFRVEIERFSFQLESSLVVQFVLDKVKSRLEGCLSALTGDCSAVVTCKHYHKGEWEAIIEPLPITLSVDQMPNELTMRVFTKQDLKANITSSLLKDYLKFDVSQASITKNESGQSLPQQNNISKTSSQKEPTIYLHNDSGLEFFLSVSSSNANVISVPSNCYISLETLFPLGRHKDDTVDLKLAPSARALVGDRNVIAKLPLDENTRKVYRLHPTIEDPGKHAYYHAEAVVEWCMQNQRLRSSIIDCYNLPKGGDLLSSHIWSPSNDDHGHHHQLHGAEGGGEVIKSSTTTYSNPKNFWMKPYLKNDSPEWTDMTCILRMAKDRVMLPDPSWIWLNDWTVDLNGIYGKDVDCDGWEYEADFETFHREQRFYRRGDACRRRRWTRTRMIRPPSLEDPQRPLLLIWKYSRRDDGNVVIKVTSPVTIWNRTNLSLTIHVSSPSWENSVCLGNMEANQRLPIPIRYAAATYFKVITGSSSSRPLLIVPTGPNASTVLRTMIGKNIHVLVHVTSVMGLVTITIDPVVKVVNLLPCDLFVELGQVVFGKKQKENDDRLAIGSNDGTVVECQEQLNIPVGKEKAGVRINPCWKPHLSLSLPGYGQWSAWHRIVNRQVSSCSWHAENVDGDDEDFTTYVKLERPGGDGLTVIVSVEAGHCPTIRVYAQYWILDKTGFGCRFCDSFSDILGRQADSATSRRSWLPQNDTASVTTIKDGHEWSIGKDGMTLFFSKKEKIALCVETDEPTTTAAPKDPVSIWISPVDISNVLPKTVLSVDERNGYRRFDLAIGVTVCPSIFSRTKLITLYPRFTICNWLDTDILVAQDGLQQQQESSYILISSRSSVPFQWARQSLPPKVRLGHFTPDQDEEEIVWTNGCIPLDKIGITSLRSPLEATCGQEDQQQPMVIQTEVRLATKEQSSAVVVVIWSATTENASHPLYKLRNNTSRTILCRQPLHDDVANAKPRSSDDPFLLSGCGPTDNDPNKSIDCGAANLMIKTILGLDQSEKEFVWILRRGESALFGFDDPEKNHILEWTIVTNNFSTFDNNTKSAVAEVDAMGSFSTLPLQNGTEIRCQIGAEHSTKVIEFYEKKVWGTKRKQIQELLLSSSSLSNNITSTLDQEDISIRVRLDLPAISLSVIQNDVSGREILLWNFDHFVFHFAQNSEGYHEVELTCMSLQVDNFVQNCLHPVFLFCPISSGKEPLIHMSVVRSPSSSGSLAFRYVAIRILDLDIQLDRRTAETIASFLQPFATDTDSTTSSGHQTPQEWIAQLTKRMSNISFTANSTRIYIEELHLHPVRLGLTFTQEWMEWRSSSEEEHIAFQILRGMASIANAPLKFTSFMVANVFESPIALTRIIITHYTSQLTKQIFGIVGSLAILNAPADFISNVGTGVRDFFYEPINGLVHGPAQFVEGLEAGTQSLARGVFVGVVKSAANVTSVVNSNLAGLTADENFMDERKAHQRMLADQTGTLQDSLNLASNSLARSFRSGAVGIWEQPAIYASKHGSMGFVKGVGKALVGAVVKPMVGVGDAAVLVMNHVTDAASIQNQQQVLPKRLRRALPQKKCGSVKLVPYDDRAAKAQKIVTGGESLEDVYIGHLAIPTHLIIASEAFVWAIDTHSREPWSIKWEEISHFDVKDLQLQLTVFGQQGLRSFDFGVDDESQLEQFKNLLAIQAHRMGNGGNTSVMNASSFYEHLPGIQSPQLDHVFGSCNNVRRKLNSTIKDEIDVIEQCFARVKEMDSSSQQFFQTLDQEAWCLIDSWGQVFSGLSSRRCITAGLINGTGHDVQIKSTKLVEGGSPCYSIPSKEFNAEQGLLKPGGCVLFFGWGVVPNLLQAGNVVMSIETNACEVDLSIRSNSSAAKAGYQVGFLEKSVSEWWAKYWLLVRKLRS